MYNVADDMRSPFTVSGITGSHDDVVNGPNSWTAMSANVPLPPRPIPVVVAPPQLSRPRLAPGDTPPDTGGGIGIQPPKISIPAPADPVVTPDDDPTSDPNKPEDKPSDPVNRLIDLIAAQMGGGMIGGPVAIPTTTTTDSSSGGAQALILIVIVGVVVFFGWKHFHKKAA